MIQKNLPLTMRLRSKVTEKPLSFELGQFFCRAGFESFAERLTQHAVTVRCNYMI